LAEQLGAETAEIRDYGARDQTRREHLQLLCREYRFRQYGPAFSADLRRHLEIEALSTDAAFTLVESAMEWLRERKVILPAFNTLESMVRSVRSKVERDVYWPLFGRIPQSCSVGRIQIIPQSSRKVGNSRLLNREANEGIRLWD